MVLIQNNLINKNRIYSFVYAARSKKVKFNHGRNLDEIRPDFIWSCGILFLHAFSCKLTHARYDLKAHPFTVLTLADYNFCQMGENRQE